MFKSFLLLELPMDASDEQIRKRYLEFVKRYPPEKEPDKFHSITSAYEDIKDQRSRVKSRLFSALRDVEAEKNLKELVASVKFTKKNVGLSELLHAAGIEKNQT